MNDLNNKKPKINEGIKEPKVEAPKVNNFGGAKTPKVETPKANNFGDTKPKEINSKQFETTQKIMDQGFKPKKWDTPYYNYYKGDEWYEHSPKGFKETSKKFYDWKTKDDPDSDFFYEKSDQWDDDMYPNFWMGDDHDIYYPEEEGGKFKVKYNGFDDNYPDETDLEFDTDDEVINYLDKYNKDKQEKNIWDKYDTLNDNQKKDFALQAYKYGTDVHDNPLRKVTNPKTKEIKYTSEPDNRGIYPDMSDYLLNKEELKPTIRNLIEDGLTKEELNKLFNEYNEVDEDENVFDNRDNVQKGLYEYKK